MSYEKGKCYLCGEPSEEHLCKWCVSDLKLYHDEMIQKIADEHDISFADAYNAFTEWIENYEGV